MGVKVVAVVLYILARFSTAIRRARSKIARSTVLILDREFSDTCIRKKKFINVFLMK